MPWMCEYVQREYLVRNNLCYISSIPSRLWLRQYTLSVVCYWTKQKIYTQKNSRVKPESKEKENKKRFDYAFKLVQPNDINERTNGQKTVAAVIMLCYVIYDTTKRWDMKGQTHIHANAHTLSYINAAYLCDWHTHMLGRAGSVGHAPLVVEI